MVGRLEIDFQEGVGRSDQEATLEESEDPTKEIEEIRAKLFKAQSPLTADLEDGVVVLRRDGVSVGFCSPDVYDALTKEAERRRALAEDEVPSPEDPR